MGTEYLESVDRDNPRHAPSPTDAVLAFADMHAAATRGWERIAAAVSGADLDSDGVINRLLAFIEAHGLGEDLADYLAAQAARQAPRTSPDERLGLPPPPAPSTRRGPPRTADFFTPRSIPS